MPAYMFNVGRGKVRHLIQSGATIKVLFLKNAAASSVLRDLDTIAAVLANGSTDEADFTNYVRKTVSGATTAVDDVNEKATVDASDITWTNAGGATNNNLVQAIFYHDVDTTDANAVPLFGADYVATTNGSNLTLQVGGNGLWESTD